MQDDLTSKIPFRDNVKNIRNLLRQVQQIDGSYYAINGLRIGLDSMKGALELVLAAEILELLYQGGSLEEFWRPVAMVLLLPSLISLAASFLWHEFIQPKRENIRRIYEGDLAAKFRSMDYSLIDSPYVKELSERMRNAHNWGNGIGDLFWILDGILSVTFSLVCYVVVAFPLLKIIVESHNVWMYLGLAALVVLICLLTSLQIRANAAYQQNLLGDYSKNCPIEVQKEYVNFAWHWSMRCVSGDYHFIKDLHLYNGYDMMEKYTSENMRHYEKLAPIDKVVKYAGRTGVLMGGVQRLMDLGGYLVSAAYAILGALPIGSTVKFAGALTNICRGLQGMGAQYKELALTARREASTLEMLSVSDEMYKGKLPVEKRLDNQYEIEFRNVSFRYPGTEQYALKDFSLKIRVGERMAIVGMNGSGKTTMIKLLCRLYDPQEGEILLNGVDIRKFDREEYVKLFSVVFQDFGLLSMPLGQNVASSMDVDRELALDCLRKAGLGERVEQLSKGLDTFLYQDIADDGVEISGGEAQKVALARALYKDAPFVLLDEPTASLDPLSEYEIYSGFDAMTGNKTAIYISHRLSSCRFCDDIAVFHEGRLVQRGSHEELLKDEQGKYYELWHAQAQYYT